MADRVAEVQHAPQSGLRARRPTTTSALMRHDSATIDATASASRANSAGSDVRDTIEQRGAGDDAVLDDLVQAGAKLAARQRRQHVGVGDHEARRMKRANEVLAERVIDADLAADRAVDLRHQRRRHLHEAHAAQVGRRGKADQVADDAAADRDDHGRSIGVDAGSALRTRGRRCQVLEALAIGDEDRLCVAADTSETLRDADPTRAGSRR